MLHESITNYYSNIKHNVNYEQVNTLLKSLKSHLIIETPPGGSKTTICKFIAYINHELYDKKSLLITFSSSLKKEIRESNKKYDEFLEIHSYHSMIYNYGNKTYDINEKSLNSLKVNQYDIILIDEAQDINKNTWKVLCEILKQQHKVKLVFVGDKNQSVFEFLNSDHRYLTMIDKLLPLLKFDRISLKTSYRITKPIQVLLNLISNENRIDGVVKTGGNVWILRNQYPDINFIFRKIENLINKGGYRYDDIFILVPSLRSGSHIKLLNKLVLNKYPVYLQETDTGELNDNVMKGKICFSTFQSSKGRERDVVFVFNFDQSYFKYYAKNLNDEVCPNTIYVACSRAKEHLFLIQCGEPFKFFRNIKNPYITYIPEFDVTYENKKNEEREEKENKEIKVTEFKYMTPENLYDIEKILENKTITTKMIEDSEIIISSTYKNKYSDLYEDVSSINSIAITSFYEYKINNTCKILRCITKELEEKKTDLIDEYKDFFDDIEDLNKLQISSFLKLATLYLDMLHKTIHRIRQILDFDWIDEETQNKLIKNLDVLLKNKKIRYEISKNRFYKYKDIIYNLTGIIDCNSNTNIYELKCSRELSTTHMLQLVFNKYIENNTKKCILYNILNTEKKILNLDDNDINNIIGILFENKYSSKTISTTDETFIENNKLNIEFDIEENDDINTDIINTFEFISICDDCNIIETKCICSS